MCGIIQDNNILFLKENEYEVGYICFLPLIKVLRKPSYIETGIKSKQGKLNDLKTIIVCHVG